MCAGHLRLLKCKCSGPDEVLSHGDSKVHVRGSSCDGRAVHFQLFTTSQVLRPPQGLLSVAGVL